MDTNKKWTFFSKFPAEIRIKIYSYMTVDSAPFSQFRGLYLSCRQAKAEMDHELPPAMKAMVKALQDEFETARPREPPVVEMNNLGKLTIAIDCRSKPRFPRLGRRTVGSPPLYRLIRWQKSAEGKASLRRKQGCECCISKIESLLMRLHLDSLEIKLVEAAGVVEPPLIPRLNGVRIAVAPERNGEGVYECLTEHFDRPLLGPNTSDPTIGRVEIGCEDRRPEVWYGPMGADLINHAVQRGSRMILAGEDWLEALSWEEFWGGG